MRVSCFFVSVAVIFAQQASAAPILGLTTLPLIEGHSGVTSSLSNTLQPVPLVGTLTDNVLKGTSEGDLISTTELTGSDLVNDDIHLGEIIHPLDKRAEGLPLVGSLPGLGMLGGSSGSSGVSSMPGLSTLSSMPGLSTLSSMPGLSTLTSMPGLNQLSSLGGIQGKNPLGGLTSALPLGGLVKRNYGLGSLPLIGSLPVIGSVTSMPGLSSLPLISSSSSDSSTSSDTSTQLTSSDTSTTQSSSDTSTSGLGPVSSILNPFVSGFGSSFA